MDTNRMMRLFYNIVAPVYDLVFGARTSWSKAFRKNLVEKLYLKKGYSVLEVGIGTGANVPNISARIGKEGRIFGMDISESMLRKCKKNMEKEGIEVELKTASAEDLPYKDSTFDAVLQFGGINFFNDKKKAVMEMFRVAKPGAKIVIGDETIPFVKTYEPVIDALPKTAVGTKLSFDGRLIKFWVLDTSKKG
jgi:ubiquinone/menaquinone biosynthesis C-methylase UbiE